jgi:peptidoglycan/LPS O-acetylase OafA/YrhL
MPWGSFVRPVQVAIGEDDEERDLQIESSTRFRGLRRAAAGTLLLFAIALVAAILVVTPKQADWAPGTELIVLGVVAGLALILVGRGRADANASPESRLAQTLDR